MKIVKRFHLKIVNFYSHEILLYIALECLRNVRFIGSVDRIILIFFTYCSRKRHVFSCKIVIKFI